MRWRRQPRPRLGCLGCLGALLAALLGICLAGGAAIRLRCPPPQPPSEAAIAGPEFPAGLFPQSQRRAEESTYLTFPEWYIVFSVEEYASWTQPHPPSMFPYFRSIGQYWCGYNAAFELTRGRYAFNSGDHLMLVVIGTSYSAEYAIKGLYEHTVGRLTEWLSDGGDTEEDRFAAHVAADYAEFLNHIPWYDYPFATRLRTLWAKTPLWGQHPIRIWERRLALSLEYTGKAGYGWLIGRATNAAYEADATRIWVWAENVAPSDGGGIGISGGASSATDAAVIASRLRVERHVDAQTALLDMPRFTAFRDTLLALPPGTGHLLAVAGNREIMLTVLPPRSWSYDLAAGTAVFEQVLLTVPDTKRIAISVTVVNLLDVLAQLRLRGVVEHIYDY